MCFGFMQVSDTIQCPMSLYLKYRPRSFADVVGQEHIVTTLEHAVDRDQLVHAYLFFGPRGTGKTSVARILAKILLIRGIEDENLQKQAIKSVDDGTLVDLIEIDAASNRGIDDVRDLKEKVQFAPSLASAKVYIIDEVHMMTKEAFNALLKTLEEPPPHAYFILATTELHKVPDRPEQVAEVQLTGGADTREDHLLSHTSPPSGPVCRDPRDPRPPGRRVNSEPLAGRSFAPETVALAG